MDKKKIQNKPFYQIYNNDDSADIYIYDEISYFDYPEMGIVSAKGFSKDFTAIKASNINIYINSPGGAVDQGFAIYNEIKRSNARITVYIDGIAASIASVIAMAADEIVINENALLMIHNPWMMTVGDSKELRELADTLDKIGEQIANVYAARSGKTVDEIKTAMAVETWFDCDEALEFGLVDTISENKAKIAACAKFDLSCFAKVPAYLEKQIEESRGVLRDAESKRSLENSLRDVGWSKNEAKRIAAGKSVENAIEDLITILRG